VVRAPFVAESEEVIRASVAVAKDDSVEPTWMAYAGVASADSAVPIAATTDKIARVLVILFICSLCE
jgi:hypothetical protein